MSADFDEVTLHIKVLFFLFIGVAIYYFMWRVHTIHPQHVFLSYVLLGAEFYGLATGLLYMMMTWRLTNRVATPPAHHLRVDVFITTYNESVDIVRPTLMAALHMEYPHETWLLDDGNREEMRDLALHFGARYLFRKTNLDAKSGNLNHGLLHATGDFLAIFDADHAPRSDFILKTLGYFKNPNVAFVQTVQDFYNLNSYQHRKKSKKGYIWTEQSLFFQVIQRGKDYWNAAFFCGTCAIIRRSALDDIGGFATGTITEDLHTSLRLHKRGYQSIYHAESLAFGIAPHTIAPFISQRIRWGQGAMQVWRKEGIVFSKGLTIPQKLSYLSSVITYFDGWQKAIFYFIPALTLITAWIPINATSASLFLHVGPYLLINYFLFEELSRGYGQWLYIEQYNMSRFFAFAYATTAIIFKKELDFRVTKKYYKREKSNHLALPQKLIFSLNAAAIPVGAIGWWLGRFPLDHFLQAGFWAIFNVLLSGAILNFSKKNQRSAKAEYRFTVPLVVNVIFSSGKMVATVDEISEKGCKISIKSGANIKNLERISGELFFSRCQIHFEAMVMACIEEGGSVQSIDCQFIWKTLVEQQRLERCLYGMGHQLEFYGMTDKAATLIEMGRQKLFKWNHIKMRNPTCADWLPLLNMDHCPVGVIAFRLCRKDNISRAVFLQKPMQAIQGCHLVHQAEIIFLNFEILNMKIVQGHPFPYYLCELREVRT